MENVNRNKTIINGKYFFLIGILIIASVFLITPFASSGVGQDVTVKTTLEVGNVFPEILNISVNNDAAITLTPNATTTVSCLGLIQDWNNDTDIDFVNATLYHISTSSWNDATPDKVEFYSNSSCEINLDTQGLFSMPEDTWHGIANCTFEVEYFAHPGDWNCSMYIEDKTNLSNREEESGSINTMTALGVQDLIDYGIVDSTKVSNESVVNITNVGNTQINLTLDAYAQTPGDNFAMNCSKGSDPFIEIEYQKYNLTAENTAALSLSEFEAVYLNVSRDQAKPVQQFELNYRQSEFVQESIKPTYWRVYVPKGLAGTCEGNIEFGATVAPGI